MRLLPVLLAVLALTACGGSGSSDPTYSQGLVSAFSGVAQPAQFDRDSLVRLSDDYSRVADRLGSLTAPTEIASTHARLVAGVRAYADDVARASALTGDRAAFAREMAHAQADAKAWTDAFEQIRSRGYASVPAS
jgi:hypothetical protein